MAQPFDLTQAAQTIEKSQGIPPLEQWSPDFCGDIDMQIKRDGRWFYGGTPIGRAKMVTLFSKVLWLEEGKYFLKTPVEKVGIEVEDAAFLFTQFYHQDGVNGPELVLISNTEDEIVVNKEHPLWVDIDAETGEPSPYVMVRFGMKGRLHRNLYYQLVELAELQTIGDEENLVVSSAGENFSLGKIDI